MKVQEMYGVLAPHLTIHGELWRPFPGAEQVALQEKQFDSLQGQEEKLFFSDYLSSEACCETSNENGLFG
jgi:hypothetical protein